MRSLFRTRNEPQAVSDPPTVPETAGPATVEVAPDVTDAGPATVEVAPDVTDAGPATVEVAPDDPLAVPATDPEAATLPGLTDQADLGLVVELLHEVIDPEVGVNIVDLGLLYGLRVADGALWIRMTLTTPGCPLGGYIDDEIQRTLWGLPGVEDKHVDLVWDPPWGTEMMSLEAKRQLGWIR